MNTITAFAVMTELLKQAMLLGTLIQTAHAEGRDHLTPEELDTLAAADDVARAALDAAIERAEAEGR